MKARLRHDALVRLLRRSGTATVDELAEAAGVSRRTILRDVRALRDQGFVIHSEAGPGGGLRFDPQSMQPTARLSVTEVFALLISVASAREARSLPFSELADSGLAKIERTLPTAMVSDLRRLLERLYIGRLSPLQDLSDLGAIDVDLLPAFEAAFLGRRRLRFAYRDARGARTSREVEPQALLILPPLWYLVAWDPDRADFRRFRMDRISRPAIVDDAPFRPRRVPFEEDVCPYRERSR